MKTKHHLTYYAFLRDLIDAGPRADNMINIALQLLGIRYSQFIPSYQIYIDIAAGR